MNKQTQTDQVKAVGLISGGLDSILAAKIIKDLGIEVHGIHFSMPWETSKSPMASSAAAQIGITYINIQLDGQYFEMVRNPKHGYGSAMNPCIDCHVYMLRLAAEYMNKIGAQFIFTGEVLGQRPMSQKRHSLNRVEKGSGLEGRLLRPLSAQLLEPTIPEKEGVIDRAKLLDIAGRSRRTQYQLAEDLKITEFKQPAGGCLLTDHNFSNRLKDLFGHRYQDYQESIILQWGRHFRINEDFKAIVGRDEQENESIEKYAQPEDHILQFANKEKAGPTVLLKGKNPPEDILSTAAGFLQYYSKYRNETSAEIRYWLVNNSDQALTITAKKLSSSQIQELSLNH